MRPDLTQARMPLLDSLGDSRTIYFCGLCKNAGKTVAMLTAMNEARAAGLRLAITSIGRDGEAFDAIYKDFAKPLIDFQPGDIVVTAEGLLPSREHCTVLHLFPIRCALGRIAAARIDARCTVEVAGPSTVNGMRTVQAWLRNAGVDRFLIDGALDRKSPTMPDLADGVVLASGAALSDALDDVLEQTRSAIDMLVLKSDSGSATQFRFAPVFDDPQALLTACEASAHAPLHVEIVGALTERVVDQLLHARLLRRCVLHIDCYAKVFISRRRWREYREKGLNLRYRQATRVLAVTVNPISPTGANLDADQLLAGMQAALPQMNVFDVRSQHYAATAAEQ
jgi:hypothetical protein